MSGVQLCAPATAVNAKSRPNPIINVRLNMVCPRLSSDVVKLRAAKCPPSGSLIKNVKIGDMQVSELFKDATSDPAVSC